MIKGRLSSTHDLTRRSTSPENRYDSAVPHFSTHDLTRGGRLFELTFCTLFSYLPHDLTRRVDNSTVHTHVPINHFNSRPHEEVDLTVCHGPYLFLFQLTTSRGGRPLWLCHTLRPYSFQLTTSREEVDYIPCPSFLCLGPISTHDLTRRSNYLKPCCESVQIFQLTTSMREVDSGPFAPTISPISFNSRPTEEVDHD